MRNLTLLFFLLFSFFSLGQEKNIWYPFFLENSNTMGFKDKYGKVMIEPKFFAPFSTGNFENIYAVNEIEGDEYYILKNGKKVGIDSVYIFDFEYATESEGKIKFRDKKTDKVGFFDKNGKLVIPAIYNDAGDFHNGLAVTIKDAVRKCWKEHSGKQPEYPNCEHWSWEGRKMMINKNNQELFEIPDENFTHSIDYEDVYRNFKVNTNVDSDIYTSYQGKDGNTYSFYSPEKDFKKWFETKFLPDFKVNGKISDNYYNENIELQKMKSSIIIHKTNFVTKGLSKKINRLFKEYLDNIYTLDFFNNNIFNEDSKGISIDLRLTSKIINKDIKRAKYPQESIRFKKIGDSFYIVSTP